MEQGCWFHAENAKKTQRTLRNIEFVSYEFVELGVRGVY